MSFLKSTQARYSTAALVFFVILIAMTITVIQIFVSPELESQEGLIVQ